MNPVTHLLTWDTDPNTGENGFYIGDHYWKRPTNYYSPSPNGRTIAHDIIEHRDPNKIGSVGDELIALGSALFIRGHELAIDSDIAHMFGLCLRDKIPPRWEVSLELIDCDFDDQIDDYINNACHYVAKYKEIHRFSRIPKEFLKYTRNSLAFGYNYANELYGSQEVGLHLFECVKSHIDSCRPDYHGQEFILTVDVYNETVTLNEKEFPTYEEDQ